MDDILAVQVINSPKYLLDSRSSVLFRELSLLANAVEELTTSRQLRDDVVFVLHPV